MQACNARPALGKLGCRFASPRRPIRSVGREFHQSRSIRADNKADRPLPEHPTNVTRTVARGSQAAADVHKLLKSRQPGHGSPAAGPKLTRGPKPSEKSPQSTHGSMAYRSLGAIGSKETSPSPTLRPRGSMSAPEGSPSRSINDMPLANREMKERPDENPAEARDFEPVARRARKREDVEDAYQRKLMEEFERPKPWTPEDQTIESLRRYLPHLPIGATGNAKSLDDRLLNVTDPITIHPSTRIQDLATRLMGGHYVRFRSEEEKTAVLAQAREISRERAEKKAERIGEVVKPIEPQFEPLSARSRQTLEAEVLEGKYQGVTETTRNPVLDKVIHLIRKNGSYTKADEASILKKLSELMPPPRTAAPLPQAAAPPRRAKKEA